MRLHSHARERLLERGATEAEAITTVQEGERFPVKFGRVGFRRTFACDGRWRGRLYTAKQVEAYAIEEDDGWLVITAIVKYFGEKGPTP